MQHIEEAGIHSGDSACVLPPYKISSKAMKEIARITKALALELKVVGLINLQFAFKDNKIFVLKLIPELAELHLLLAKQQMPAKRE